MVFCVGGMDICSECCVLDCGVYIVVVIPGWLCDYIEKGVIDLLDVCVVVLDEVDEMFDLGFCEDLEFILGECFEDCQMFLFLVIVFKMIMVLVQYYQNDVVWVVVKLEICQYVDIEYCVM